MTVGAFVILEVFDGRVAWSHIYAQLVVDSLAGIFDTHTKVSGIVVNFTIFLI